MLTAVKYERIIHIMKGKILIIEDEPLVRRELKAFLEENEFEADAPEPAGLSAKDMLSETPDLILLDIGLGDANGISLCQAIRKKADIPVIFVTGQDTAESEILGFRAGGDDYIRKPYHLPVLLVRIQSLLERSREHREKLTAEGVTLDLVFGQLFFGGESYELSKKEQQILFYLFRKYPGTVGREELMEYLWDNKLFVDENILNVNLSRIRRRLKGTPLENFIRTVPEQGYQIGGVSL